MKRERECCNYCMWLGPVNQNGTMRKHRPATKDDKWGRPNMVQDMDAAPCPGSHKPYARFGTTEEATEDAQETTVTETAEYQPSPDAAIGAARTALAELKDKGWKSNPVYWVGRLEAALEQTLKAIDKAEGANAQETNADDVTETASKTGCKLHRVEDRRGGRAIELGTIPTCESGVAYGAWSEGAGGFVYTGGCVTEVANWAADELRQLAKDNDTDKFAILAMCPDHDEQPKNCCEECAEDGGEPEADDEEDE